VASAVVVGALSWHICPLEKDRCLLHSRKADRRDAARLFGEKAIGGGHNRKYLILAGKQLDRPVPSALRGPVVAKDEPDGQLGATVSHCTLVEVTTVSGRATAARRRFHSQFRRWSRRSFIECVTERQQQRQQGWRVLK
jgi:hypothetical protein